MGKKSKIYFVTEEELERFDHMLTALAQAYWALVHQRSVTVDFDFQSKAKITEKEADFYQLHLDLNSQIENEENL